MIPNLKQSMHLARSTGEATSACPSTTVMSAERARGKQPLSPWSLGTFTDGRSAHGGQFLFFFLL
jgi:hypothetical protein